MKAIIFGATGMVGMGTLLECPDAERVERVLLVSRHPVDISHPKTAKLFAGTSSSSPASRRNSPTSTPAFSVLVSPR
jgi:hypothetical protein